MIWDANPCEGVVSMQLEYPAFNFVCTYIRPGVINFCNRIFVSYGKEIDLKFELDIILGYLWAQLLLRKIETSHGPSQY